VTLESAEKVRTAESDGKGRFRSQKRRAPQGQFFFPLCEPASSRRLPVKRILANQSVQPTNGAFPIQALAEPAIWQQQRIAAVIDV
jgi:hypothetical protein